jgi:hypothetical protein
MTGDHVGRRSALKIGGMAAIGAVGAGVGSALVPAVASAAPFGFTSIVPYRSFDTRDFGADGRLSAGQGWDWDLWTDGNGNPRIPQAAAAVTFNLTVTQTTGAGGWLAVYPANSAFPGVSSINWFASGLDLANGGTVALGQSVFTGAGSVQVGCGAGSTHYMIDVTGFYS